MVCLSKFQLSKWRRSIYSRGERETIVDCDEDCEFDKVVEARGVEEDNVFICSDTQVILRINSTQHDEVGMQNSTSLPPATASVAPTTTNTIAPASNNPNHKSSVDNSSESLSVVSGTSKLYSKRMTKRITSTIQMSLNSSEESPAPITESNLAVQDKRWDFDWRLKGNCCDSNNTHSNNWPSRWSIRSFVICRAYLFFKKRTSNANQFSICAIRFYSHQVEILSVKRFLAHLPAKP